MQISNMTRIELDNLNDHRDLLSLVDDGLKICETLAKGMDYARIQHDYDLDILLF